MRILINAISAKRGGIATYTQNLVNSLSASKIDFDLYVSHFFQVPKKTQHLKLQKVNAAEYGVFRRLFWEQTIWRFMIWRSKANIVFSSANYAIFFPPKKQLLLLREGGLFNPLYRNNILPRLGFLYQLESGLRRRLMLISALHAHVVMVPSETMQNWILTEAPSLKKKVLVNLYGSDTEKFANTTHRNWRADGTLRMLYVSVYYPHKDPLTFVKAVAEINTKDLPAHATITMDSEQFLPWRGGKEELDEINSTLDETKLTLGHVEFNLLPKVYQNHDIMVFPSVSETFGHSLVEAMASGIPIIAADTLTSREICGPAALYFPPFDAKKLRSCILALDSDPNLRNWLVERGQDRVKSRFQLQAHFTRLFDTFSDLENEKYKK